MLVFVAVLIACPPSSHFDNPPDCALFGLEGCICCDWNENGTTDPDDLADYIGDYFNAAGCADITLDGHTDCQDMTLFLDRFFGG